jgi:sugar phosphate isomerase/epimerase
LKISALVDIANIIGPEILFVTGDLINNAKYPPQERAAFFYEGAQFSELKGMHGFNAATFSVVGNHDFLEGKQPGTGYYKEKSEFWNRYHGLQCHHFTYGSTRCMVVNTGWNGFDWTHQLHDHMSWLNDAGPGDFRVAAYHKSENGIMGAWANQIDLDLAVIRHNHHLAKDNPYDLGGRDIQYYADSLREHFCFNLFRVHPDGNYTVVNNQDAVENPADDPFLWKPKLTLDYANSNEGTSLTNTATLVNKFDCGFPRARVRFVMPKAMAYTVSKGTIRQQFDGDSVTVVDISVAIDADSSTSITIMPSDASGITPAKGTDLRSKTPDQAKPGELDNLFYCFNNGVRLLPDAPDGFDAQAALVKKIGYDGLAGQGGKNYYRWRDAMDKVGLVMPEIYIRMGIDEDRKARYDDELKNIIKHVKDRDLLIAFVLYNDLNIEDRQEADRIFIEGIRELADYCRSSHVRIAVYPHANLHCETVAHSVSLAKAVNRNNVGAIFNLCHSLKVEGQDAWQESLNEALPYLFMVSVNGAETGDTQKMGWDKLIQPLGEGAFDTYELIKFLKDNGYDGLFGLQCYNIKQDCEQTLTKSMSIWKSYQNRYRQERN